MVLFVGTSNAHEMTPTYPKLELSYMDGLYSTTMRMFNKRADVEFYEIAVFDKDFNPIPFASTYRIVQLEYLSKVSFEVFVREKDVSRATYVCSRSKLRKGDSTRAAVSSRICSKFK